MITIGNKKKVMLFDVSTDGINNKDLDFWLRVYDDNVSYSFKGELQEDSKIKVTILPLTEMLTSKYINTTKIYPAKLEIIGDGKYNLTTWEGEIQLEAPPKVDIKLENVQEDVTPNTPKEKLAKVVPKVKVQMASIEEDEEEEEDNRKPVLSENSLLKEVLQHSKQRDRSDVLADLTRFRK